MAEAMGRMKCPICSSKRARVSVTKAGRCCVTCNACHFQGFARSDYSDTLIRQAMTPEEKAQAAQAEAPKMPEPAPGMEIAPIERRKKARAKAEGHTEARLGYIEGKPESAPEPEPEPEPAAKPKRSAWDIY